MSMSSHTTHISHHYSIAGTEPYREGYTPHHLRQAALFGHYNKCVDILDHWSEVTPNDRCEVSGLRRFF